MRPKKTKTVQTAWGPVKLIRLFRDETPGLISECWFGGQVSVNRRRMKKEKKLPKGKK